MNTQSIDRILYGVLALLIASPLGAQTGVSPDKDDLADPPKTYSPYVERSATGGDFAEGVFWGDTHLHTAYSTDAGMIGNRLGPEQAYRFALGEVVTTSTGQRARLIRPLDFLVISDHAENLGLAPMIAESNPDLLKSEWGRAMHDLVKAGKVDPIPVASRPMSEVTETLKDLEAGRIIGRVVVVPEGA